MRNVILIVLGLAACVPWPLAAAPTATDFLEGFNARYECLAREGLKGFHCRVACSLWDQYLADRRAKWGPRDRRVLALDKVRFTLDYPVKGRLVAGAEPVLKTGGKALEDEAAGVEAAVKGMLLEHLGPWLSLAVRPAGGEAGDPDRKVVLEPGAGGFLVFQESGQPVTEFFDMGGKIFELARGGTEGVQSFKPDLQKGPHGYFLAGGKMERRAAGLEESFKMDYGEAGGFSMPSHTVFWVWESAQGPTQARQAEFTFTDWRVERSTRPPVSGGH